MSALFGTETLERVASALRDAFGALGGERIDLPSVQPLVPYLEFLGEAYRQNIVEHGGDELCLCPDLTLALALQIASGDTPIGTYQFDGLVFRGSRGEQTASPIQRQMGAEIFGAPGDAGDDAKVVLATCQALTAAGVTDYTITFADPGLVFALIDSFDLHENWQTRLKKSFSMPATFERDMSDASAVTKAPALSRALASLPPEQARDALSNMFETMNITPFGARSLDDITERLTDKAKEAERPLKPEDAKLLAWVCDVEGSIDNAFGEFYSLLSNRSAAISERLKEFQDLLLTLRNKGVNFQGARFDANLARELSYYDGFVFECHASDGSVLGSGGRYDGLLSALSGGAKSSGAVGAMLRPDRIAALIEGGASC
ncbi:MAG: ATP phosphoribosyltransferase regulatory subunit [Pseudomonadota bacterium]